MELQFVTFIPQKLKMTNHHAYWIIAMLLCACSWRFSCNADELPTCQPKDFHYEFTDCDEHGGRWRVSVPTPGICTGGAPNAPIRVNDCNTTCNAGSFFNVSALSCQKCPAGSYSLGGRIVFDVWKEIPSGFNVIVENFQSSFRALLYPMRGEEILPFNCTRFGWQPFGDVIASQVSPCSSTLVYIVTLIEPGNLTYSYQYVDDSIVFQFQAQNGHCQSIDLDEQIRWPPLTEEGKWNTMTLPLEAGLNVFKWKTIGVNSGRHRHSKSVMIKKIEITGLDYSSICVPCKNGTYSSEGATTCEECSANTYSGAGASKCLHCNKREYSVKGSSKCSTKELCKEADYYEVHTPCDSNKETQITYKWIEPKICNDEPYNAKKLPPPSSRRKCPPCNPGMYYSNASKCVFCPANYYSDENHECQPCPASAAPNYGYQYNWWNELPPNIEMACMSMTGDCHSSEGWLLAGDHIRSRSEVDSRDPYVVLVLKVPGFRTKESFANENPVIVGNISFTFQLSCTSSCDFLFMQQSETRGTSVIQSWNETHIDKQHFVYHVRRNDSYLFSWLFLKHSGEGYVKSLVSNNDHVKIFTINVTNTIDGGATECVHCRRGFEKDSCVPCPAGHYFDSNSTQCKQCPPDTFASGSFPYGIESCQPCGPGLHSTNGHSCYSDCIIQAENERQYNLTNLAGFHLVRGGRLFSSSGTEYFHNFNLSLCGEPTHAQTSCVNNLTTHGIVSLQGFQSKICRSTIILVKGADGYGSFSTQSISLGDQLVGITTKKALSDVLKVHNHLDTNSSDLDLHFFYSSPVTTESCPNGRWTTVTLRCDSSSTENGSITLPPSCPTGTCDGCSFHLLWTTKWACPMCTIDDYEVVAGECSNGVQTIHYITLRHCIMPEGVQKLENRKRSCSAIPEEIQIVIGLAALFGVLLLVLVIYFWKKNRKLEYKYMKLVRSASSKDGELPTAESCALHDDEEDHFDSVEFKESKNYLLINKLRSMAGTKITGDDLKMPLNSGRQNGKQTWL